MDPITNNQMNSMYQAPLGQQPTHKTSIISIVVLLLIAIIVTVLGFGRIKNINQEQAEFIQNQAEQARMMQIEAEAIEKAKADEASILTDIESIGDETNDADLESLESAF